MSTDSTTGVLVGQVAVENTTNFFDFFSISCDPDFQVGQSGDILVDGVVTNYFVQIPEISSDTNVGDLTNVASQAAQISHEGYRRYVLSSSTFSTPVTIPFNGEERFWLFPRGHIFATTDGMDSIGLIDMGVDNRIGGASIDFTIYVTIDGGESIPITINTGIILPQVSGIRFISGNDDYFNRDFRYLAFTNQMFCSTFDSRQTDIQTPSGDMQIIGLDLTLSIVDLDDADDLTDFLGNWKVRVNLNQEYAGGIYIEKIRDN